MYCTLFRSRNYTPSFYFATLYQSTSHTIYICVHSNVTTTLIKRKLCTNKMKAIKAAKKMWTVNLSRWGGSYTSKNQPEKEERTNNNKERICKNIYTVFTAVAIQCMCKCTCFLAFTISFSFFLLFGRSFRQFRSLAEIKRVLLVSSCILCFIFFSSSRSFFVFFLYRV